MNEFILRQIEPTKENAQSLIRLTAQDLDQAGMKDSEIRQFADPQSLAHIESQKRRLDEHPERYLGAVACGNLVGFSKTGEWTASDHAFFSSSAEQLCLKAVSKLRHNHLKGRPFGIFSLVADQETGASQSAIQSSLLSAAVQRAFDRRIFISEYPNDSLRPLLQSRFFKSTGRYGYPLGSLEQELFVRPPVEPIVNGLEKVRDSAHITISRLGVAAISECKVSEV